jgi:hypothetical protein
MILISIFFFPLFAAPYGYAGQNDDAPQQIIVQKDDVPIDELDVILSSEDFGKPEQRPRIKLRQEFKETKQEEISDEEAPWVKIWNLIAAYAVRALVLLLISAALIFFIIFYRKIDLPRFARKKIKPEIKRAQTKESAGLLLEAAKIYYERGKLREAWAAVYQAALAAFRGKNIAHPLNATEYECLSLVTVKAPAYTEQFKQLVRNRIRVAYRSIIPAEAEFVDALSFCRALNSETKKEKR